MTIAIFSDTHDNWPNIEKAIKYLKLHKIRTIIHCGDICASITIEAMAKIFKGEIHFVKGNVDGDVEGFKKHAKKYKNLKFHGEVGKLEIDNLKIAFCHFPEVAKKLALTRKFAYIFHGHTHKPWISKIGQTTIINPGTLAGLFSKATFALFDTQLKKPRLFLLEKI